MKLKFLSLALISAAAGCTTTTVQEGSYYLDVIQRVVNPASYYGPEGDLGRPFENMPNGRVLLMVGNQMTSALVGVSISSLENGQIFDAAVGLFRAQSTSGLIDPNQPPIGRMAFQLHYPPAQVGSAALNNDSLSWTLPGSGVSVGYSYAKSDPNLNALPDTMAFSYADFNGETFKDTLTVAPTFGLITFPDSISVSQGCVITYQHPIPNDSIEIYVTGYGFDTSFCVTRPDTGSIVFAPNQLPVGPFGNEGFFFYFYRWNWTTRTTPEGRKIAIYSSMATNGQFIPTKP